MKKHYRDSVLARKIILGMVLCSSIITLLLTCAQLYKQYSKDIDQLSQSEQIIRESMLHSLSESVWEYDDKLIKLQLKGMLSHPYIEHATLILADGQQYSAGKINSDFVNTYEFDINHKQNENQALLGSLFVYADLTEIYEELVSSAATTLLANAIKTFGVVMFMLFLMDRLIGRHLIHTMDYLKTIETQTEPETLRLNRPANHVNDDMDELADTVNAMQRRIYEAHQQLMTEMQARAKLQEQLLEQNQQLAQLDRVFTMGEMATSLAHELNQPLASITGFADICKRLINQPEINQPMVEKTLEKVSSEAMRASEIIRRTREFVRNRSPQRESIELQPLLLESVSMLQDMANKKQVQVTCLPAPGVVSVEVDKVQLQQVLINLVRNAIEAVQTSNNGQVELAYQYGDSEVAITVIDNGPGLSQKVLDNLFQPFITTKENGMGVGLSICHSIIEAHGGRMQVENQAEGGACFTIVLPNLEQQSGDA